MYVEESNNNEIKSFIYLQQFRTISVQILTRDNVRVFLRNEIRNKLRANSNLSKVNYANSSVRDM